MYDSNDMTYWKSQNYGDTKDEWLPGIWGGGKGGGKGGAQEIFKAVKIFCAILSLNIYQNP